MLPLLEAQWSSIADECANILCEAGERSELTTTYEVENDGGQQSNAHDRRVSTIVDVFQV